MSSAADLWALQETDLAIEALRRRLTELQERQGETLELQAARQAAEQSSQELERWRKVRVELEGQVREMSKRIQQAERDLMSGRVRNPKELEGMQANVGALKRRRSGLEDEVLEAMLEIDSWQDQATADQDRLSSVESAWRVDQQTIGEEIGQGVKKLKSLTARLNQLWQGIDKEDQQLYRSLRGRKGGRALALMQRDSCQACGMRLPTGLAQHTRAGDERVLCPTCGRLLYAES
jgi:predicted  nucleic acid-binding Zn-ribbon protein